MDLGPLRALVLDLNVSAHGVAITVTRPPPDDTPITLGHDGNPVKGIWVTPTTEDMPAGEFSRREVRRVMALSRADVPTVPKGTVIEAPEKAGDVAQRWRVDGFERGEADHVRVIVVPAPDEAT